MAKSSTPSSFDMQRRMDGHVALNGNFVHGNLRWEVEGSFDTQAGRPGPLTHRLSQGKTVIFEATMVGGDGRGRVELRFGKGVHGPSRLNLDVESLRRGVLVGGDADGRELLPMRAEGCGCSALRTGQPLRPLLAWGADGQPQAVRLSLPKSLAGDGAGLADAIQTTVALRISSGFGGLGDIIDVIDWVFCWAECVGELIWCVLTEPTIPKTKDIFDTLCFVLWGGCTMVCRIKTPF